VCKDGRCLGLTSLPLSCAECLEIFETHTLEALGFAQAFIWIFTLIIILIIIIIIIIIILKENPRPLGSATASVDKWFHTFWRHVSRSFLGVQFPRRTLENRDDTYLRNFFFWPLEFCCCSRYITFRIPVFLELACRPSLKKEHNISKTRTLPYRQAQAPGVTKYFYLTKTTNIDLESLVSFLIHKHSDG
jgi:hypothetical protein